MNLHDIKRKNLTIKDASKVYGISTSVLYKLSMHREIPILKIGKRVLIPIEEFEGWLSQFRVQPRRRVR